MGRVKLSMDASSDLTTQGPFEARYVAFLETIPLICARSISPLLR